MTTSPITIRIAFLPYWVVTTSSVAISALIFLPGIVASSRLHVWHGHITAIIHAYLVGLTGGILFTIIGVAGIYWLFPFRVTNTEINGYNFWGFPLKSSWNEVTEMKPFNFLGLKFLRIYSESSGLPTWFPLQISKRKSMEESIAQLDEKPRQLLRYLHKK